MSTAYDDIKTRLQGSMVALVTPMHPDGTVDYERLADLIDWQIEQGTHCLVAVGTTGESATLSMQEHSDVIRFFVQHVNGRVPVYQHYKAIAEAVDIPQMLYNVPGRTVVDISQETVERLADIDNIVAIKDATGSLERGEQLIKAVGDRMVVLSGDDATALELMKVGARMLAGQVAMLEAMSESFSAALRGDFTAANAAHDVIKHLHHDLFIDSSPMPTKYALYKMGMIDTGIRLPLVWLAEEHYATIDNALTQAKII